MAKKTQRRLERKKTLILEEAKKLLNRYGKNTSMGDIAAALEIDTSGLYYYFKSIPEIIDTILDQEYHDFSLNSVQWKGFKGGPLAKLKAMVQMILEFYYDNREILQIILSQAFPLCLDQDHEEDSVAINHYLRTYREANDSILVQIELAQKEKELSDRFPPSMILQTIRGAIFGLWAAWKEEARSREEIPEIIDRLFLVFS